ncbi:hypothetical protein [Streptacidiphilus cavernicola]|uniref:Uncharacterized protein n=1 Tax=Streptacidiphilus cavernicola TaxID=3342716 RepID=A0ABV6W2D6_9ACTN
MVRVAAHDQVALAEIDLYGDLIIAAAATPFERLSADRIDQVLRVRPIGRLGQADPDDVRIPVQRDPAES